MENLQKLAPPIRFPEFTQNLRQENLGDIAKFLKGKGISKSDIKEDGINECIRYGELYTHYKETISNILSKTNKPKDESVLSQKNDVIIPSSGETQLDIVTASCVMKPNVILGGDLNIIRSNEDGVYLSYYLNSRKKIDIAKLSQGNSVVHLYAKQLSTLKINLPEFSEQKKIATFLSSVDKKLDQLQKKKELLEQYKKGMMQKIFKQEIRFKDENGNDYKDWKIRKLGEFCNFTQGIQIPQSDQSSTNGENRIRYLYIRDFFSDSFPCYVRNEFPEKIILRNEIMIVNTGNTAGEVYRGKEGVLSNNSFKVTFDKGKFNSSYMFIVLKSYLVQNQIKKFFNSGGQPHLGHKNIALVKIPVPDLSEQVKIADFISAINYKIGLVTTEIEKASQFKKGLLQQMFV